MSYQRTQDIIDQARAFHTRLVGYYGDLSEQSHTPRLQLLLDYLSRHESNLAAALKRYESDASRRILETWFSYVPDERELNACAILNLDADMDADELVDAAMRYDDCLISLYRQIERTAAVPEVREVFANLLALEEQEKHQTTRNALSIYDL